MTEQTPLPETAITNEDGHVAIRFLRNVPLSVKCNGNTYAFGHMRANINMLYVAPEDVPCVLAVRTGCCGQKRAGKFIYASEDDVRRWTNGGGR